MAPVRFCGMVHPGQGRGRQLGFPTANVGVDPPLGAQLPRGVFAGIVQWDGSGRRGAVINIGTRPTFAQAGLSVEVHVLDFSGDLYGKKLAVELLQRLRGERRFAAVELLVSQIERDVEKARTMLQSILIHQTEV